MKTKIESLSDLYRSREFESFIESKLGNDLFISEPDRAERIHDAAEDGGDGSTHAEHIEDWREFLDLLSVIDPDYPEDNGDITQETYDKIKSEIAACEDWHEKNGSLHQEIG